MLRMTGMVKWIVLRRRDPVVSFRKKRLQQLSKGVDEWLIRTVMALYTDACTVVRKDAGLSESLKVKFRLHQGSVLSPLLFAAVMDVVSSEARSGMPSELMYADDLILMSPTMEQLGRRVAEWRAILLDKGLKVNAGKSEVIVCSSGGKMIVNSGKWPSGKGVQANSVQCIVCKHGFTGGEVVCVVTVASSCRFQVYRM